MKFVLIQDEHQEQYKENTMMCVFLRSLKSDNKLSFYTTLIQWDTDTCWQQVQTLHDVVVWSRVWHKPLYDVCTW